jgi:hypothetical protein
LEKFLTWKKIYFVTKQKAAAVTGLDATERILLHHLQIDLVTHQVPATVKNGISSGPQRDVVYLG